MIGQIDWEGEDFLNGFYWGGDLLNNFDDETENENEEDEEEDED